MEPINYGYLLYHANSRKTECVLGRVTCAFVDEMNNIVEDYYKCGSSVSSNPTVI